MEIKTEADSNDITECPRDDITRTGIFGFCRAMLCISAAYAVMRRVSVCLSVTFVRCVKMNKDIFNFFSLSGSHTVLVFPHQTVWQSSDGNPPNVGVECRWGRQKLRF